ncbi:uncharacterized protein LOC123315841 [Coccinella septempunctata]|uniref:uncharacterized protein LOC123315841 n=1 Tax=Coccinella septempunctata TaxID=41139 RepID=UPI001D0848B0|nr:uncharacterized protein LOC123315841 [Coccinella septempunctata]
MWITLISICSFFTIVMSLVFCLCWKKKRTDPELTGVDGLVIKKNPDENVNHLPSADLIGGDRIDGISDVNKRATLPITNTRRSLPDIPFEHENATWVLAVDNSSEHYATVEQYQNSMKRHTLPNGVEARRSISQHSSLSQADFSPYERVKYDKINSREHPYDQLQPIVSRNFAAENADIPEEPGPSQRTEATAETNPTRRGSGGHNLDIPAASAVAGGIAASPELPYMTPPVPQINFSGDSQDSSKGYTSISVREPLANILAQSKEVKKKREFDPHYSTVSDDSDDVYTTIPDPNQVYTSESETYARIPPGPIVVEAEINRNPSKSDSDEANDEMYEPAPQPVPPSVDSLKHVTHTYTHSRQASSSSSTINIGSPKPEKRQANSPLPLPPVVNHIDGDKKLLTARNLEDLYAKVQKNKPKNSSDDEKSPERPNESSHPSASTSGIEDNRFSKLRRKFQEHNYETLRKHKTDSLDERMLRQEEPGYASINGPDSLCSSDPGYEVLKDSDPDPNYEELKHKSSNASDIGYSKIKDVRNNHNFGYSVVNKKKKPDASKNYNSYKNDSQSQDDSLEEPNYESMPSESISEFNYAALKSSGSETDPNYESVSNIDPNYESVKYVDEPPYEKVDSDISQAGSEIPGYERVGSKGYQNIDTSESSDSTTNRDKVRGENPYERLKDDGDTDSVGYSKIKDSNSKTKNSSVESSSSAKSDDLIRDDAIESCTNILDDNIIFEV